MGEATIYADRAPTPTQREALEARQSRLEAAIAPPTRESGPQALRAVMVMLAGMPSQGGGDLDMELRGEAMMMAIDDLPGWAILAQARRVIRGETKLPRKFAPTPAEFREVVSDSLAPIRAELSEIDYILHAKIIPAPPPMYLPNEPGARTYPEVMRGPINSVPIFSESMLKDLAERRAKRAAQERGEAAA